MSDGDRLSDLQDLLHVGLTVWIGREVERADHELVEQWRNIERRERRCRLAQVKGGMLRVAEVDAQIELMGISPNVPNRDMWLGRLRDLRELLLERAKGC